MRSILQTNTQPPTIIRTATGTAFECGNQIADALTELFLARQVGDLPQEYVVKIAGA